MVWSPSRQTVPRFIDIFGHKIPAGVAPGSRSRHLGMPYFKALRRSMSTFLAPGTLTRPGNWPRGEETNYRVPGMTQQGFLEPRRDENGSIKWLFDVFSSQEMLQKCKPNPATGMLYVFKNRYWNEEQKQLGGA